VEYQPDRIEDDARMEHTAVAKPLGYRDESHCIIGASGNEQP
jgi:hypothetical protein